MFCRQLILLTTLTCCLLCAWLSAQQENPSTENANGNSGEAATASESLADRARRVRKDHTNEVQMSAEDAKKLFSSVDKIIQFASEDSGFPRRVAVKRQMVGKADVEKFMRAQQAKQEYAERFARSELTMKKFGLLPRNFDLNAFLVRSGGQEIAGYYDDETKTISMLNWVPFDQQAPILAHELTHALQDQNYDLERWMKSRPPEASSAVHKKDDPPQVADDSAAARKAVVEGQATLVYIDYLLAPMGRNLKNTPALLYQMEDPVVKATVDSQVMHDAPMILREAGAFPYQQGLIFEGKLLAKGGTPMAFAGAFAHPPRSTHEILQPNAYIENEKLTPVEIPDVRALLDGRYEVYDSGSIGELDMRALLKQYGERKVADDLASSWRGGAYLAFRKSDTKGAEFATTADLALLYVSRWKSQASAERFSHIYTAALPHRYENTSPLANEACAELRCPVFTAQTSTEEGPVVVQLWADGTVVVSESFDLRTAVKLLAAARDGAPKQSAQRWPQDELSMRLFDLPAFLHFQSTLGEGICRRLEVGSRPGSAEAPE
jgi:hypothetical protein